MAVVGTESGSRFARFAARPVAFWLKCLLFAVTYFMLAHVGAMLTIKPHNFVAFWLPSGLYVAVLLMSKTRDWPALVLAALVGNLTFDVLQGRPIGIAAGFGLGNSLEALTGAWLVRTLVAERPDLSALREVVGLITFSAAASTAVSASIGSLLAYGAYGGESYWGLWLTWWSGDAMGILLLTPVLLTWVQGTPIRVRSFGRSQAIATLVLFVSVVIIFGIEFEHFAVLASPRKYLMFPIVMWVSLQFGTKGASLAVLLMGIFLASTGACGIGIPPGATQAENMEMLNLFLISLSFAGILPAAVISESRRKEQLLQTSEARYKELVETASAITWRFDLKLDRWTYVAPQAERILGYAPEEWSTLGWWAERVHGDDRAEAVRYCGEQTSLARDHTMEYRMIAKDGRLVWIRDIINVISDVEGPVALQGVMIDISESKAAEQAMANQRALLDASQRLSRIGGFHWDVARQTVTWTDELFRIHGFTQETKDGESRSLIDRSLACYDPDDRNRVLQAFQRCADHGQSYDLIFPFTTEDGSKKWIRTVAFAERENGHVVRVIGNVLDITASKMSEIALAESEAKFRSLFENMQSGFALHEIEVNDDGEPVDYLFLDINAAYETQIGLRREDIIGRRVTEILPGIENDPAGWIATFGQVALSGASISFENYSEQLRKWYSVVAYRPNRGQFAVIVMDITGEKQIEVQLRQSQKMEAIGTLAGGIAHDFNNILCSILGNTELAADSIPAGNPAIEHLSEISIAGERAAGLVHQILTFARRADKQPEVLHVVSIVEEVVKMLRASLPSTIKIRLRLDTDTARITADPTEIHQVVMNLCTNAGQVMLDGGGVLEIGLTEGAADDLLVEQHPGLQIGQCLILSVSDTGPGMSPDVQKRIFDPFFTTKGPESGTGLGLAVVHGIVKNLGGAISLYSEAGHGSAFKVYLPVVGSVAHPENAVSSDRHSGSDHQPAMDHQQASTTPIKDGPFGSERVLVVDDEPALIRLIKAMLESLGYAVTAFSSSEQALEEFLRAPDLYDLFITDQTMPALTGIELAKKILRSHPGTPIILCTGFSQTAPREKAEAAGIAAYITKPFSKKDLATTIRNVLDA